MLLVIVRTVHNWYQSANKMGLRDLEKSHVVIFKFEKQFSFMENRCLESINGKWVPIEKNVTYLGRKESLKNCWFMTSK